MKIMTRFKFRIHTFLGEHALRLPRFECAYNRKFGNLSPKFLELPWRTPIRNWHNMFYVGKILKFNWFLLYMFPKCIKLIGDLIPRQLASATQPGSRIPSAFNQGLLYFTRLLFVTLGIHISCHVHLLLVLILILLLFIVTHPGGLKLT